MKYLLLILLQSIITYCYCQNNNDDLQAICLTKGNYILNDSLLPLSLKPIQIKHIKVTIWMNKGHELKEINIEKLKSVFFDYYKYYSLRKSKIRFRFSEYNPLYTFALSCDFAEIFIIYN